MLEQELRRADNNDDGDIELFNDEIGRKNNPASSSGTINVPDAVHSTHLIPSPIGNEQDTLLITRRRGGFLGTGCTREETELILSELMGTAKRGRSRISSSSFDFGGSAKIIASTSRDVEALEAGDDDACPVDGNAPLPSEQIPKISNIQNYRKPIHLLWLVFGVGLGLLAIEVEFASINFGDPLDSKNVRQYYCAYMCSTVWMTLFTLVNVSLIHELVIKRRVYGHMKAPPVPYLLLRYVLSVPVGSGSCLGLWVALYKIWGSMLPFHGTMAAIFGALVQSSYLYFCLLPRSYYVRNPELTSQYIVLTGTFGIVIGSFIFPMLIYWIALIFYQLAARQHTVGLELMALILFQLVKIALIHYEMWVVKMILGPVNDNISNMLAISIISILHNSFYCTAVESSPSYVAVIVAILGNAIYALHRGFVLLVNIDVVLYIRVNYVDPFWHSTKNFFKNAIPVIGRGQTGNIESASGKSAGPNASILMSSQKSNASEGMHAKQISLELEESNRAYLTLQFLSWEVYKFLIPLMYLAAVYIVMKGQNAEWMGGLGRTVYQYSHDLTNTADLELVREKLLVLAGCDAFVFIVEAYALSYLDIDLYGVLCYTCSEVGYCFALLLGFLPLHNLCITAIACGMDFTMTFEWMQYGDNYFKEVARPGNGNGYRDFAG